GLFHGWDELRAVPRGGQSGLRVIVLFTDGCSNSVPGIYDACSAASRARRTWDFPKVSPDPDGQTHDFPHIDGLYVTQPTSFPGAVSPDLGYVAPMWNSRYPASGSYIGAATWLPLQATISERRAGTI